VKKLIVAKINMNEINMAKLKNSKYLWQNHPWVN
jgi:hypothetical protein